MEEAAPADSDIIAAHSHAVARSLSECRCGQVLAGVSGTWDIVGDTLKITTQQEVDDPVNGGTTFVDTTWAFNYVNNGNEIILSQTIPVCDLEDDDMTCAEMYESIELLFGLDAGSITDAQLIYQLLFERTTAKPFARITESSTPSDAVYIMKRITDFGEVIRSK